MTFVWVAAASREFAVACRSVFEWTSRSEPPWSLPAGLLMPLPLALSPSSAALGAPAGSHAGDSADAPPDTRHHESRNPAMHAVCPSWSCHLQCGRGPAGRVRAGHSVTRWRSGAAGRSPATRAQPCPPPWSPSSRPRSPPSPRAHRPYPRHRHPTADQHGEDYIHLGGTSPVSRGQRVGWLAVSDCSPRQVLVTQGRIAARLCRESRLALVLPRAFWFPHAKSVSDDATR